MKVSPEHLTALRAAVAPLDIEPFPDREYVAEVVGELVAEVLA